MGRIGGGCYWDNEKIMEFYEARERHYESEEAREAYDGQREESREWGDIRYTVPDGQG